MNMINK